MTPDLSVLPCCLATVLYRLLALVTICCSVFSPTIANRTHISQSLPRIRLARWVRVVFAHTISSILVFVPAPCISGYRRSEIFN
jgi:hypothetical protein